MDYNFIKIDNFDDAKRYLDSFIDYEKKNVYAYKKVLKLGRVKTLLKEINIPYRKLKAIHIAGTKGKGSTATFCANILAASGYRVGLYTSPHFFDFRERIQVLTENRLQSAENRGKIRSNSISKKDVVRIVKEFRPILEKLRFNKRLGNLSFFEVYTAIAFKYFLEKKLDFAVLETGLGGRLDATNVISPLVSVITHIGYDHTDKLGKRLSQIAAEKAGIIKKNVPVVSSLQKYSAAKVITKICRKMGSELFTFGKDFKVHSVALGKRCTNFDFRSKLINLDRLQPKLKGRHQVENAALAVMAITLLRKKALCNRKIEFKRALKNAVLPGRFELLYERPLVIADIAHNPPAFCALAKSLKLYFPSRKIILIFAASCDKDIKKMLKLIYFQHIILTTFNNPRAFMPEEIRDICKLKNSFIAKDIKQGFSIAKKLYNKDSLILISGSVFLVSEAKKLLQAASYKLENPKACSLRPVTCNL